MTGNTPEFVGSPVVERDLRAHSEVAHRRRRHDGAGPGSRENARRDVDSDTGHVRPDHLDLARVDPRPNLDAELGSRLHDGECARYGPSRTIEGREEAIAGRVDLAPGKPGELTTELGSGGQSVARANADRPVGPRGRSN